MAGLLALGAAAIGIGAGISVAAWGIGEMASGIGDLVDKSKGSSDELFKIAAGVGAIGLALTSFTLGTLGLATFGATMATIAMTSSSLAEAGMGVEKIATNITNLTANRSHLKEIKETLEAIANIDLKNNTFSGLREMFNKPLKVEFADSNVGFKTDITLEIDGERFLNKSLTADLMLKKLNDAKNKGVGQ